jgi:hypothetical protein
MQGRGRVSVVYRDKNGRYTTRNPAQALVTLPDGTRTVVRGDPGRAGFGTKQAVSYLLHPRQHDFETRGPREVNAILRAFKGRKQVAKIQHRRATWDDIYKVVPKGTRATQVLGVRVTFRGQTRIVSGTRDAVVDSIIKGGMLDLTEGERARLWTGPSGKAAAARITGEPMANVPDDFLERQAWLDDQEIARAPLTIEVFR